MGAFRAGLKTIEQATEIRRRILQSFEEAERTHDLQQRRVLLTFIVVGGGPTGVELAGAIGEMSRFTLSRDFKRIDSKLARVILVESGDRVFERIPAETLRPGHPRPRVAWRAGLDAQHGHGH